MKLEIFFPMLAAALLSNKFAVKPALLDAGGTAVFNFLLSC
jgi:hypothetical protein